MHQVIENQLILFLQLLIAHITLSIHISRFIIGVQALSRPEGPSLMLEVFVR